MFNKLKKILAGLLVVSITAGNMGVMSVIAATTADEDNIKIEAVGENILDVQTGTEKKRIIVEESDNYRIVTILDVKTEKSDYLKYNKQDNTLYSSITGETVSFADNGNQVGARSVTSYETKKISYASLKKTVGEVTTVAGIIGGIVARIPGLEGLGSWTSIISGVVVYLNSKTNPSSKHGIKIKVKVTKYYRNRMGRRQVYKTTRTVNSMSTY